MNSRSNTPTWLDQRNPRPVMACIISSHCCLYICIRANRWFVQAGSVVGRLAEELLQPVNAGVNPLAGAAGVGVMDEDRFPGAFQGIDQHMMHNAVAEVGGEDFPQFGALDDKADGTSGRVGAIHQRLPQRQQVFFLPGFKAQVLKLLKLFYLSVR